MRASGISVFTKNIPLFSHYAKVTALAVGLLITGVIQLLPGAEAGWACGDGHPDGYAGVFDGPHPVAPDPAFTAWSTGTLTTGDGWEPPALSTGCSEGGGVEVSYRQRLDDGGTTVIRFRITRTPNVPAGATS